MSIYITSADAQPRRSVLPKTQKTQNDQTTAEITTLKSIVTNVMSQMSEMLVRQQKQLDASRVSSKGLQTDEADEEWAMWFLNVYGKVREIESEQQLESENETERPIDGVMAEFIDVLQPLADFTQERQLKANVEEMQGDSSIINLKLTGKKDSNTSQCGQGID